MSIAAIDRLQNYNLNREITNFLMDLKYKAMTTSPYRLNELYAIIPPVEICWNTSEKIITLYQLDGILSIKTNWDELNVKFWYYRGEFFCSYFQCFKQQWSLNLENWDVDAYKQISQQASREVELLRIAFNTPLLHVPAIRQLLQQKLQETSDILLRNCMLEIFISLLNEDISKDEVFNQDFFLKRARIRLNDIFTRRASLAAQTPYRDKHALAAIKGSEALWQKLFPTIIHIWGHLANQPYLLRAFNAEPSRNYAFEEKYHSDGRVTLSEIFPADRNEVSKMVEKVRYDVYREVFPAYDMALFNHKIAANLIREI